MATFTQFVQKSTSGNKKWLWIGGAVILGVVLLLLLMRGGSRGSASAGDTQFIQTGPSEALQAAQLQASVQQSETQAMLSASMAQTQAQFEIEKLRTANEALAITSSLDALAIQAQSADRAGQREFEARIAGLESEKTVALAGIKTQAAITQAQISGQIESERLAAQSLINQQALFIQGQVALEQTRTAVDIANITASRDVALQQEQTKLFALTKAKKKHIPAILAGENVQLGTKTNAILGGVFSLGGLLSDIRRKSNILPIGARIDGLPTYSFEYTGAPGRFAGVMAQELERMAPEFVLHTPRGLLVDYGALDASARLAA